MLAVPQCGRPSPQPKIGAGFIRERLADDTGPCMWQQEREVMSPAVFWMALAQEVCSEDTSGFSPEGEIYRDMSHPRSTVRVWEGQMACCTSTRGKSACSRLGKVRCKD